MSLGLSTFSLFSAWPHMELLRSSCSQIIPDADRPWIQCSVLYGACLCWPFTIRFLAFQAQDHLFAHLKYISKALLNLKIHRQKAKLLLFVLLLSLWGWQTEGAWLLLSLSLWQELWDLQGLHWVCRQHQSWSWLCCLWISGANFIPLRICYSVHHSGWNHWQGKIWAAWPQDSVEIKISLAGLLNSARWFWFSSLLVSGLAGECQSRNGYKRWELVSDESTCSRRAAEFVLERAAAGTVGKAPQSQGWESSTKPGMAMLRPCWSPVWGAAGAGMQLECSWSWVWLLLLSPASAEPWAGTKGLEGRPLNLLLWRWVLWGLRKPGWVNLQPEDPKGSVFVQNEWFHGLAKALLPVL